jgi:hypothetical protein
MKSLLRWIFIVAAFIILLLWVSNKYHSYNRNYKKADHTNNIQSFNRNANHLIYTKHARCRMQCRDITPEEVKEILHDGNINYAKSELNDKRGPKYALEGYSNEHQHLRIIFAPEDDGMVVVTTIDLDKEWPCNCN